MAVDWEVTVDDGAGRVSEFFKVQSFLDEGKIEWRDNQQAAIDLAEWYASDWGLERKSNIESGNNGDGSIFYANRREPWSFREKPSFKKCPHCGHPIQQPLDRSRPRPAWRTIYVWVRRCDRPSLPKDGDL